MGWLLLLLLSILPAQANTSCAELEKAWRGKYTVDFDVTWNLVGFKCPGGESTVAQALWDLEHLELPEVPGRETPDFYDLVHRNIDHFARDHADKGSLAYTSDRTLTVCSDFYKDERWDRASTLVHEARHSEPGDPGHVACWQGPYKGKAQGCDHTFWDGGWKGSGFNIDVVFYSWLRRARAIHELRREVIDSDLDDIIPDRFNRYTAAQVKKWRR